MKSSEKYAKISITAKLVAFLRTYSDIPYSQELSDKSHAKEDSCALWNDGEEQARYRAPQFEARHKLVTNIIERLDINQVLEIAAGLSARGMALTKNPDITYVETDLPGIIKEKEEIVKSILADERGRLRPNLIFQAASAFNSKELQTALQHFSPETIAIVSEGLLTYLNRDELLVLTASLHELLSRRAAVWITDIPTGAFMKRMSKESVWDLNDESNKYETIIGRPFESLFETDDDVKSFFEGHGFKVLESHPYSEIASQLTCVNKLNIDMQKVSELLNLRSVFVLEVAR